MDGEQNPIIFHVVSGLLRNLYPGLQKELSQSSLCLACSFWRFSPLLFSSLLLGPHSAKGGLVVYGDGKMLTPTFRVTSYVLSSNCVRWAACARSERIGGMCDRGAGLGGRGRCWHISEAFLLADSLYQFQPTQFTVCVFKALAEL